MPEARTRIKICGITTPDMAAEAVACGADYVGLVFAEGSPRQITDFTRATEILDALAVRPGAQPVGVFRHSLRHPDPHLSAWTGEPRWCQLHGDVHEPAVRDLARSHRIIRGLPFDPARVGHWDAIEAVSMLLLDGSAGGEGRAFRHDELAGMMGTIAKPVMLAGGLRPETVADAIRKVRPFAVDVSSGVESAPGVKDAGLIRAFCDAVRGADGR